MALAIFDLDNTLLAGDSDYLWGQFLLEQGLVDEQHQQENQRFYDEYEAGTLDIMEFLRFCLKPLTQHSMAQLNELHKKFMTEKIAPILQPSAKALIDKHRQQGDYLLIITATNLFITAPIAQTLDVDDIIATLPAMQDGVYTGDVEGVPSFKEGKVTRLKSWLELNKMDLAGSYFYSDSHNDLPLLEMVEHPVAVDADPTLLNHAKNRGWPTLSLRSISDSKVS